MFLLSLFVSRKTEKLFIIIIFRFEIFEVETYNHLVSHNEDLD
jgi:hypothetical protein